MRVAAAAPATAGAGSALRSLPPLKPTAAPPVSAVAGDIGGSNYSFSSPAKSGSTGRQQSAQGSFPTTTPPPARTFGSGEYALSSFGQFSAALDGSSPGVASAGPSLSVASAAGSRGTYTLASGAFAADVQDIGRLGSGQFVQQGGTNAATQVRLGAGAGGAGEYHLTDGALVSRHGPAGVAGGIQVGGEGSGTLLMGGRETGGTIFQPPAAANAYALDAMTASPRGLADAAAAATARGDAQLVVRADAAGRGVIRGWGIAAGSGPLVQNGQVVADGYGQPRDLVFVGYTSVTNAIDNPADGGANGWFARDGGRLLLPQVPVAPGTHTYTWGDDPADPTIDLVNSVRVTIHGARSDDRLEVALLATDHGDVPALPGGHTFIGVWSFDTAVSDPAGGVDLVVRYDDTLAADLGLDESILKLWRFDNGQWLRINDASLTRDLDNHILSGHAESLSFFAVSAPEPGGVTALLLTAGWALLRRRRSVQH